MKILDLHDTFYGDTICGHCCGSQFLNPKKKFSINYGIAVADGKVKFTPSEKETFDVVQTKSGPLSVGIRHVY